MKTPDEIKKALKCYKDGIACYDCPYEQGRTFEVNGVIFGCSQDIAADALAYIEQLEAENAPGNKMPVFITTPKGLSINVNRIDGVCVNPDGSLGVFVGGAENPFTLKDKNRDVFLTALQKYQHPCDERLEAEREEKSDDSNA